MLENLSDALQAKAESREEVQEGCYLFHLGDSVEQLYVVEQGFIKLTRFQEDGAQIILQRALSGDILAESSMYSDKYHCDAIATVASVVLCIPKSTVQKGFESGPFSLLWGRHLARETQRARFRSELLSRKTVAARLDGWLDWSDNELPAKGEWKNLAFELAVSPEALYREIARRRNR